MEILQGTCKKLFLMVEQGVLGARCSAVLSPAHSSTLTWLVGRLLQFIFSALAYSCLFSSCLVSKSNHEAQRMCRDLITEGTLISCPSAGLMTVLLIINNLFVTATTYLNCSHSFLWYLCRAAAAAFCFNTFYISFLMLH